MSIKFATRLRRRQRNRQKALNTIALFWAILLPIYPAFGNYIQDYTGAIVRGNYDASTIISTYDATTGEDIMYNVLDANNIDLEVESDGADGSAEIDDIPGDIVVETPPSQPWTHEDSKKVLYPIHVVTPKQTLEVISQQYGVSIEEMKNANPWLTSDLKIDQKIVIPKIKWVEYVVKKWDVLSIIAAKYGIDNIYHILLANNLTNASKIRIGQKLFLPNPTKDPTAKKPAPKPVATTNPPKTPTSSSTKKPAPKTSTTPKSISYGTYSLKLQVEKWCRNFAWWNCTCFVAKYKNVTWRWNAKQWLKNAQKAGVPTGSDPRPGAIVVYDGYGYSPYYGHVGIVMEVGKDYIIVKDMNYSALNQITTRREDYRNNWAIKGYIYAD